MPMIATEGISGYNSQEWFMLNGGNAGSNGRFHFLLDWSNSSSPTITVTKTTAPAQESNPDASIQKYIYYGQDKLARLYFKGGNTYEITLDFSSEWGFLLRTSNTVWDGGTKYGAIKGGYIRFGEALPLK